MGKLKSAYMQIMMDDMGGGKPVDEDLAKYILGYVDEDVNIASDLQDISTAMSRLNTSRGSLAPFADEIDILTARLTKLAQRGLKW
jgi:hypothetical protein